MLLQIDFGSIVPSNGRKKTKRLELCVEIYAKNEKRQIFSKSAKNIHGLKLNLVPLCQMPKEERAENFET